MKKTLKKIGQIAEYAIYIFLIGVLFIILSPRLPTKNLLRTYIVPTGSMTPTILPGSVAVVNPKQISPRVGDIVAFLSPQDTTETILHRIVSITDEGYKTKGDFNTTQDTWTVPYKNIQGTLVVVIPYIGHIAAFVKKPIGFVLLAVIPALMLGFASLVDIKNGIHDEYKKHRQKKEMGKLAVSDAIFFCLGFSVAQKNAKNVYAAFSSQAIINGLSISAATATPAPTIQPTSTPTPTPSPTPKPDHDHNHDDDDNDCDVDFKERGWKWDEHKTDVHCSKDHLKIHFPHLSSVRKIHYSYHYDCDEGHEGIDGEINLDGEQSIDRDFFSGSCSSGTCNPNKNIRNRHIEIWYE